MYEDEYYFNNLFILMLDITNAKTLIKFNLERSMGNKTAYLF